MNSHRLETAKIKCVFSDSHRLKTAKIRTAEHTYQIVDTLPCGDILIGLESP